MQDLYDTILVKLLLDKTLTGKYHIKDYVQANLANENVIEVTEIKTGNKFYIHFSEHPDNS